jgi:hypothetical protein
MIVKLMKRILGFLNCSEPHRRNMLLVWVSVALAIYISSYHSIVEAVPSGIFQFDDESPVPKRAIYPIGREVGFGSVRSYRFDRITRPLFTPINLVDRRLRPSTWF